MKRTILVAVLALAFAVTTDALAAGALKGRTYSGTTSSSGVNHENLRTNLSVIGIRLVVSHNGRTVTARFTSAEPLLYCRTGETIYSQSTKPASISSSGRFSAAVGVRFAAGPGAPPVVELLSGRFSGRKVSGTIRTHAAECSGSTSFSATAR